MKNRGFTLVELLAVIVIIGVVSLIVFPNIMSSLSKSREKAYDTQKNEIIAMAKKWATNNMDKLDEYHLNNTYITFSVLKEEGYMAKNKIKNPKNREEMIGCIEISYNNTNNSYDYNYYDSDYTGDYLTDEANACDDKIGYIYTYKDGELDINKDNAITIAYDKIYDDNVSSIKVVGQTDNGLYDMGDDYVFRGSDVSNYVKFKSHNDVWRIMSLNKKNKTMKLIKNSSIGENEWDSNGNIKFENSTVKTDKLDEEFNKDTSSISKIANKININSVFNVGGVDVIDNFDVISSKENIENINHKIGLMTISEYLMSSTTCDSFDATSCSSNNYIYDIIKSGSAWTINNNSNQIWYIATDGNIYVSAPNGVYKNYYPVIELNSNISITDGLGTNASPYIIE